MSDFFAHGISAWTLPGGASCNDEDDQIQKPLSLDFGAAQRAIGDMTQALTVILKAGYAPVEHYAEVPGMKQGPWTDGYALGAVLCWAITGKTPPPLSGPHGPRLARASGRMRRRAL